MAERIMDTPDIYLKRYAEKLQQKKHPSEEQNFINAVVEYIKDPEAFCLKYAEDPSNKDYQDAFDAVEQIRNAFIKKSMDRS